MKIIVDDREHDLMNQFTELQPNTGDSNAFRQVALITDVVDKTTGDPAYSQFYIGPSHPSYGSLVLNNIDANKGYVLYINNLKKVVRDNGQEEDVKIAITF